MQSSHCLLGLVCKKHLRKNTIRDGGSTALKAAYTVDTVDTVNSPLQFNPLTHILLIAPQPLPIAF